MNTTMVRPLALLGFAYVAACGSTPTEKTVTTVAQALTTQSGQGRFQTWEAGGCLVPEGGVVAGTAIAIGTCAAASSTPFVLGPSLGYGDAWLGVTTAPTVRTGSQGTLHVGDLCLEGNPQTGSVILNTCQHTCPELPGGSGELVVDTSTCPSYPGGVGLNDGSANGMQEWFWSGAFS